MIVDISSRSRQILSKSGHIVYKRAKHLRGAIIVLPFLATVLLSYIYLLSRTPPLWLQDSVVFSAPLLAGVVLYCKTWIYRFRFGAPLLGMALGGALFFPVVVCVHVRDFDVTDNGIGLAVGIFAWAVATFLVWRLFQTSTDVLWNMILARFRRDRWRWIIIAVVPLVWAEYAFGAFELVDSQFDRGPGRAIPVPGSSLEAGAPLACLTLHPGFLGAPWRQLAACPPKSEPGSGELNRHEAFAAS